VSLICFPMIIYPAPWRYIADIGVWALTAPAKKRLPTCMCYYWTQRWQRLNYMCLSVGECRTALGMNSGEIPDSAITASSSFDPLSVGPTSARSAHAFTQYSISFSDCWTDALHRCNYRGSVHCVFVAAWTNAEAYIGLWIFRKFNFSGKFWEILAITWKL